MKYLIVFGCILIVVSAALTLQDRHDNQICEKYGELNNKVVEPYNGECFVKTDKGWWKL